MSSSTTEMNGPYALSDASIAAASSTSSALPSIASALDGALAPRLAINTVDAASHVSAAVATALTAAQQCVPAFVSRARAHLRVIDKRLEMQWEEFDRVQKTFTSISQLCTTGDEESIDDTAFTVAVMLSSSVGFVSDSTVAAYESDRALRILDNASRVSIGIDPSHVIVSHARWLTREARNSVSISLLDADDAPVYGVAPTDVRCTVDADAVGWMVNTPSVRDHIVVLEVELTPDCAEVATLHVTIGDASITLRVVATASSATLAAALAECLRVGSVRGLLAAEAAGAFVAACTAALSSPAASKMLVSTVNAACGHSRPTANGAILGAAGATAAVVAALRAHGVGDVPLAAGGCEALSRLATASRANAESIALAAGGLPGLDVICELMAAHPQDMSVQVNACWALCHVGNNMSSPAAAAAMRASRSRELILTAKANFPEDEWSVDLSANAALAVIRTMP